MLPMIDSEIRSIVSSEIKYKLSLTKIKTEVSMQSMSSYERVMNRLEGKKVDKVPNMNIVMDFAAKQVGATLKEFLTDYRVLVESKIICAQKFGIDTVSAISDPMREAQGFGAMVIFPENDNPYCLEHRITHLDQVKDLMPVSPFDSERMLDRIRAIELFSTQVKGNIPIIGWVEGALAEAADLRDISLVMMDLILEPNKMDEFFSIIFEQQKMFAKAQIDAGADFIGIGNAAASLVGPQLYEEFCLSYDTKIIEYIHGLGAKAKLHICGNTEPILELIAKTGADIFDIDHAVNFARAIDIFKGTRTAANGNLDPVTEMMQASESEVDEAVNKRLKMSDSRTFISGGCEIPARTTPEVMIAMNHALYL